MSCKKLDAYLVNSILGVLLRILWQLFHIHKHAVQLRLPLGVIIPQDVADARVHNLRKDAIADCSESQEKQSNSHHHAAAADAAGPAAAAALSVRCGDDAEDHKQRHSREVGSSPCIHLYNSMVLNKYKLTASFNANKWKLFHLFVIL